MTASAAGFAIQASHPARPAAPSMDTDQIRSWIVAHLSRALQIPPDQLDVNAPLTDHGLDSIAMLQLTGALEEMLERPLPATLVLEYPTIEILARHLAS